MICLQLHNSTSDEFVMTCLCLHKITYTNCLQPASNRRLDTSTRVVVILKKVGVLTLVTSLSRIGATIPGTFNADKLCSYQKSPAALGCCFNSSCALSDDNSLQAAHHGSDKWTPFTNQHTCWTLPCQCFTFPQTLFCKPH